MNVFIEHNNKKDIGKLIHVGAGNGIDLNGYISQQLTDIILLEPIPKTYHQLENKIEKLKKTNASAHITALNVALCGEKLNDGVFYITQPNRYSGFHKASKLKSLFQNLKIEQEIEVQKTTLSDLINSTGLDANLNNTLVLQINGAEYDVLSLATEEELMTFSSIIIQHTKKDYFEGAKPTSELLMLMESMGFELSLEENNDVVFSHLVFRKDESKIMIASLNDKLTVQGDFILELENQLKESDESNKANVVEINKSAEQSKVHTARITELESLLNESKTSNETKAVEVNKSVEQSKAHAARITELESQLKTSNEAKVAEVNKSVEQSKAHAARITELESQLKTNSEAKVAEVNKSAEQSKAHTARITELESQLKASNEAKSAEVNKSAEQSKAQTARITELESQLKSTSNGTKELEAINLTLESEKQELIYRQTILDTEIVKVEAQLELVKDVVLREKAF